MKNNIYLTAIITSLPGKEQFLKVLLLELLSHSRNEQACIQYDLHQSEDRPEVFIFHEEWSDQAGLDLHNKSAHLNEFVAKSVALVAGSVLIYRTSKLA